MANCEEELLQTKSMLKKREKELKEKEDELEKLKAELQIERNSNAGGQPRMTNGFSSTFSKSENYADEISRLNGRIKKLEDEISRINEEIETLKKENIKLKTGKEDAEMNAVMLRDEKQEWESKNDRLEKKLCHNTNRLMAIAEKIEQLEKGRIEDQKEIQQLKQGRKEAEQEIKQLKQGRTEDQKVRIENRKEIKKLHEKIEDMVVDANLIYIAQIAYNFAKQVYYIVLGKDLYKNYDRLYNMSELERIVQSLEDNNHPNNKSIRENWKNMKVHLNWKPEMAGYLKQLREMRISAAHPVHLYKSKALDAIHELKRQNKLSGPISETFLNEIVLMWEITRN